jgi:hypothetical protein
MNFRKWLYFSLVGLRGQPLGKYYHKYLNEFQASIPPDTTQAMLMRLFQHCKQNVHYYSNIMKKIGGSFEKDSLEYL